jgi:hypothetical protein
LAEPGCGLRSCAARRTAIACPFDDPQAIAFVFRPPTKFFRSFVCSVTVLESENGEKFFWPKPKVLSRRRFQLHFSYIVLNFNKDNGAGEGNRTLVSGLGSPHSAIEPHPRVADLLPNRHMHRN